MAWPSGTLVAGGTTQRVTGSARAVVCGGALRAPMPGRGGDRGPYATAGAAPWGTRHAL